MSGAALHAFPSPAEVLGYTNDRLLRRYAMDFDVSPAIAQKRFEGLKQFLYVCAVTPGYKVTSDAIDSMWHTFLLFTKDYRSFCERYLGKFINHEPFEEPVPEAYVRTREVVEATFGKADEELWPAKPKLSCSSGCE